MPLAKRVLRCFKKIERSADRLAGRAGPLFVSLAIGLIAMSTGTYFEVFFARSFLRPDSSLLASLAALALSFYLLGCLLFHYAMACIVSPGSPLDPLPTHSAQRPAPCSSTLSSSLVNWLLRFSNGHRPRSASRRTIAAMKAAVRSSSTQPSSRLPSNALEPPDRTSRASSSSRRSSNHSPSAPGTPARRCAKCLANGVTDSSGVLGPLKPERAHHCRICGVCWLKYDHHCPWINQCVGLRNERYFVLFLIYMSVCTSWVAWLGWPSLLESLDFTIQWTFLTPRVCVLLTWVLALAIGIAVGIIAIWQLVLISRGETYVESSDNEYYKKLVANQGLNFHHPFDLGTRANLELFFNTGPGRRLWITILIPWPVPPSVDGWNWPKRLGWQTTSEAVAFADQLTDEEDLDSDES